MQESNIDLKQEFRNLKQLILENIDLEDIHKNSKLKNCIDCISDNVSNVDEEDIEEIISNTLMLSYKIESLMSETQSLNDIDKTYLEDILSRLNDIKNRLYLSLNEEEMNLLKILNLILFKKRSSDYFKALTDAKSDVCRDEKIYGIIIDNYILSLINDSSEYIYYEKLISLFYTTNDYKTNKQNKDILYSKITDALKEINLKIKSKERKRIEKQLQIIKQDILKAKTNEMTLSDLNKKYFISNEFSAPSLLECQNIFESDKTYVDLTNEYVVSIDKISNHLIDDAFSLKKDNKGNYILTIYIADVEDKVKVGSNLDVEAYQRGFTLYLPGGSISMLPYDFSKKNLSLNACTIKNSMAHRFIISSSGDLISQDIFRAKIKLSRNFSYNDIRKIINKGKNKEELEFISDAIKLSEIINIPVKIENYKNIGEQLIAKFMVLTNYLIAQRFKKEQLPFIYCIKSNEVQEELFKDINDTNDERVKMILKSLDENCLDYEYSLKSSTSMYPYTHITNPIRNYVSLVLQRLETTFLLSKYSDKDIYFYENYLNLILKKLNERRQMNEYYRHEYIKFNFHKKKR